MNENKNTALTQNAKALRKSMTKEERHLWYDFLKHLPVTINRQKVLGRYIVDFYIAAEQLVIELDGSQHYDPVLKVEDEQRDDFLKTQGLTVVRYSNADVNTRFDEVCSDIYLRVFGNEKASP